MKPIECATLVDVERVFGVGSEIATMLRPRRPHVPQPREPEPEVVTTARQRRLAEALSDAYDGCCGDSCGAKAYYERAAELLAELDAMRSDEP